MNDFMLLLQGLKGTMDLTKGLKSAYDSHKIAEAEAEFFEKLSSLYVQAISLYESHSALAREKDELEKKLVEYQQWDRTASQYSLKALKSGAYVYTPNESNQSPNPMHWICPKCYGDRKKSILQFLYDFDRGHHAYCPECKGRFGATQQEMLNASA